MCCDDRGQFICARSNFVRGGGVAKEAEAPSLKEALSWVKTRRNYRCIFELDAQVVVDAVRAGHGKSIFHTIIDDYR